MPKRRANTYHSADELLDQLGDIYELPLVPIYTANHQALSELRQREDQSFPDFYMEFMRVAANCDPDISTRECGVGSTLAWTLRQAITRELHETLRVSFLIVNDKPSLSQLKNRCMELDSYFRNSAIRQERKKAREFASQYDKAVAEIQAKKPGKYSIIARPDPEEFRR